MTEPISAQQIIREAAAYHVSTLREQVETNRFTGHRAEYALQRADLIERALAVQCKQHRCDLPPAGAS